MEGWRCCGCGRSIEDNRMVCGCGRSVEEYGLVCGRRSSGGIGAEPTTQIYLAVGLILAVATVEVTVADELLGDAPVTTVEVALVAFPLFGRAQRSHGRQEEQGEGRAGVHDDGLCGNDVRIQEARTDVF